MKRNLHQHIIMSMALLCLCCSVFAQEQNGEVVEASQHYLESRTTSLDKYLQRSQKIQDRLLKKLRKKEARFAKQLQQKDSAAYAQYIAMPLSYDSIATIAKDSTFLAKSPKKRNATIDSLKKIQGFAQEQVSKLSGISSVADKAGLEGYTQKLEGLQQQLNAEQQVKELIARRTKSLESLAGNTNISGLKSIQKEVFYAGEKIKAWKELSQEPDEAEAKALEFLQGSDGFDQYFNKDKNTAWGGLGDNATAADLERMGFQTKRQTSEMLQQTFGNNLNSLQQGMSEQIQQFQEQIGEIGGKVKEVKSAIDETKAKATEVKQNIAQAKALPQQIKNIEKPAFKKNPERGKPFWQRIEKQYNFQTTRPTPDGRPAMLELEAGIGFKHTPTLSYGIGLSGSVGLGQGWEQVRISYEGIGARAYADYQLQYGISLQAGYEKIFRPANRPYIITDNNIDNNNSPDNNGNAIKQAFGAAQDAAYLGLMKRYRLNSKWNGTFLIGYNFLWQQSGTRSPLMVRIGWAK